MASFSVWLLTVGVGALSLGLCINKTLGLLLMVTGIRFSFIATFVLKSIFKNLFCDDDNKLPFFEKFKLIFLFLFFITKKKKIISESLVTIIALTKFSCYSGELTCIIYLLYLRKDYSFIELDHYFIMFDHM